MSNPIPRARFEKAQDILYSCCHVNNRTESILLSSDGLLKVCPACWEAYRQEIQRIKDAERVSA